jgi:ABC-2 type transport system ATP-binding protein
VIVPAGKLGRFVVLGSLAQTLLAAAVVAARPGVLGTAVGALAVPAGIAAGAALYAGLNGTSSLPRRLADVPFDGARALHGAALVLFAVAEEVLWRGALFSILIGRGTIAALVITTLGFAGVHFYAQSVRGVRTHLVTGCAFGVLRLWTSSIAASVAAHVVYNALVLVAATTKSQRRATAASSSPALTKGPSIMQTSNAAISVRNLRKSYGGRLAVDGVSFDIHAGEAVALLGPNGAGKTSTISVLLGLRKYDSGEVRVFGEPPLSMQARRMIGVTQQRTGFPPTATVREVMSYIAALHDDRSRPESLLDRFGLASIARRQAGDLSGGEQRRLSVALAFVGAPKLVVLDEPTTSLDVEARRALWDALKAAWAAGTTILLTTHYLQEAEALANRAIVISRGRLLADASISAIRAGAGARRVSFTSDTVPLGFAGASVSQDRYSVLTTDADATVRELFERNVAYRDLEVSMPSLEDIFLNMVSKAS